MRFWLQCAEVVDFVAATSAARRSLGISHVIDFGPGRGGGITRILQKNLSGHGVQVHRLAAPAPRGRTLSVASAVTALSAGDRSRRTHVTQAGHQRAPRPPHAPPRASAFRRRLGLGLRAEARAPAR